MAIKYSSTLLAQSNEPTEIQKADLDLLKKINEIDNKINEINIKIEDSLSGLSDSTKTFIDSEISKYPGRITSSYVEYDNIIRNFSTTWENGKTTANYEFKGNSKILVLLHIPMRNDSTSWGGGYMELQYSLNGGAYTTLGNSGYDGPMSVTSNIITNVNFQFLLDIGTEAPYQCSFRLRHKSYDGTLIINGSHDIIGDEFFSKIIMLEINKGEQTVIEYTPNQYVRNYFYRYSNTNIIASQYIHFKTNQTMNSIMNTVHFEGYEYGSSKPINAYISYYPYQTTGNISNIGYYGSHTCGAYKSSDGYAVITILLASTYYSGIILSQMGPGPQGLFPITITSVTNSSSATGIF